MCGPSWYRLNLVRVNADLAVRLPRRSTIIAMSSIARGIGESYRDGTSKGYYAKHVAFHANIRVSFSRRAHSDERGIHVNSLTWQTVQ